MAKFCFFTDPAKLAAQAPGQEFGPAAASGGKDRFRVADVHSIPSGGTAAQAYAVCRGQVCVQAIRKADGSVKSINLILRPLVQPPFDFPYVEYFIYRGLLANSPLASAAQLDREEDSTQTDGGKWGGLQPIDHLFRYAGGAELAIVEAEAPLGEFGAQFGFEVIVQQYGAQPYITWVRSEDATLDAIPLATATLPATAYASRLQREALGCFVDPCAFWGLFWSNGLTIPGQGIKKGVALGSILFADSPAIFSNRKRLYLDIRNEAGLSYDFYGTWQDQVETGLSETALHPATYSTGDWPIYYDEPAANKFHVRLRRTGSPAPLLYRRDSAAFEEVVDVNDPDWTRPIAFERPAASSWWFAAQYLRGETATATAAPAAGAFDTSLLQFGPIGDRAISAYRQLWPATPSTTTGGAAGGYERLFVTDKVLRHDGGVKADPLDPARILAYDRLGETSYVFQKGTGANSGKDSVIVFQRRAKMRTRDADGPWNATASIKISSSGGAIDFELLTGELLANLVWLTLDPVKSITVPSRLELRNNTAVKAEMFDYTILLLSKAAFAPVVAEAMVTGRPAGPGEKHPTFLSLTTNANPPSLASAYDLGWQGWDGQVVTKSAILATVYSGDGILFASPDLDRASLITAGTQQVDLTPEEKDGQAQWDSNLQNDTLGTVESARMPGLADAFIKALGAIGTATPNAPAALLALVEQHAPAIWNRAVELVKDEDYEEWADRLLYYARLKMMVALKSHATVAADPTLAEKLGTRFESLSRNYELDFAAAPPGAKCAIVTGFDPFFGTVKSGVKYKQGDLAKKEPNPSARLALYFAANPTQSYSGMIGPGHLFFIKTCILPNRYIDFDNQIVERTLEAAAAAAVAVGKTVKIVCTVSLDDNISNWARSQTDALSSLYCKIDGFAARCRSNASDNLYVLSNELNVGTLPTTTKKEIFYETMLKPSVRLSDYDHPNMRVRYDPSFAARDATKPLPPSILTYNDIAGEVEWKKRDDPFDPAVKSAVHGSGGNYFSNESYYRSSNLLRQSKYAIKNGHIHIPSFGGYIGAGGVTVEVRVLDLAKTVVAVLDGSL